MNSFNQFQLIILLLISISCQPQKTAEQQGQTNDITITHRPQFHFSPDSAWMNDPNGMVYHEGVYHLFYQYYPDSTVWGPMHWGHAVSSDLVSWEDWPIAIYPGDDGYIFSGSAVFDQYNTSGLGTEENPPLVAIYTIHDPVADRKGDVIDETQGIAYSLDNGKTWMKYENNPVLKNPGIEDFRDPKVNWHEASSSWVMTLAVKDHIRFYSSKNLIDWNFLSEFGKEVGAHGGVWECPDLFQLETSDGSSKKWVLFVSINPGGPNGGSATQYFVGDFEGVKFTPDNVNVKWIDYGPDNYAGVTWSNAPDNIFLGWMGNWLYAQVVPTEKWRSAMTIPRKLELEKVEDEYYIRSRPIEQIHKLETQLPITDEGKGLTLSNGLGKIKLNNLNTEDFTIIISNSLNEKLIIGYERENDRFFIDRSKSGKVAFHPDFKNISYAPRISPKEFIDLTIFLDHASVEIFADDGLTVMTSTFFPNEILKSIDLDLKGEPEITITKFMIDR